MRKDELLHLHQLLASVQRECRRRDDATAEDFENYERVAVSPLAAHESKGKHRTAVEALAADVAGAVSDDVEDRDEESDAATRQPAST